jgi:murein DD-endopeptidase MepM/ murein hydrolase activator NlpD
MLFINIRPFPEMLTRLAVLAPLMVVLGTAQAVEFSGTAIQGGLLKGHVAPGAEVFAGDRALQVSPDGYFLLGFGRDAPLESQLTVELPDGERRTQTISLEKRTYEEQRVDGLPQNTVTPSRKELDRIWAEQKLLNAARARDDERTDFLADFMWPVTGRISSVYGSRRILNGTPKRPHMGVDIAAPQGTPVLAPASGVVSLVYNDMFYTGGTLMLQHGHGLSTMYVHLSKILVKKGQEVKQGDKIAEVGMTGRATGPHLHWAMTLHDVFLDPSLLVGPMPAPLGASAKEAQ